jgi:hypothetical protein
MQPPRRRDAEEDAERDKVILLGVFLCVLCASAVAFLFF